MIAFRYLNRCFINKIYASDLRIRYILLIGFDVHTLAKDLYTHDVYIHAFLYTAYPYITYSNTHLYVEVILLIQKYIFK